MNKKNGRSFFDKWAEHNYTKTYNRRLGYQGIQNKVVHLLNPKNGQEILDLGVGTGTTAKLILNIADCRLRGVDMSRKMLREAEKHLGKRVTYINMKFQRCYFKSGSFDAVISVLSLHHLTRKEKATILPKIHRWLKPGGKLILGEVIYSEGEPRTETEWADNMIRIGAMRTLEALQAGGVKGSIEPFESTLNGLKKVQEFKESLQMWKSLLKRSGFQKISSYCIKRKTGDYVIYAEKSG